MGKITAQYKKAVIDDILQNITSNVSSYYAFAASPRPGNTTFVELDGSDKDIIHDSVWSMVFGKKIVNTDVVPLISRINWTTNTAYTKYDNTSNNYYSNSFYAVTEPAIYGGFYHVYKCLDNANGVPSTQKPDQIQLAPFTKSDGYTWKYMYSISSTDFLRFATADYVPIIANVSVQNDALNYSGIDNIILTNTGQGYDSYHNGIVRAVVNSTMIQIEASASSDNNFYTKNGIYLDNDNSSTSQLRVVSEYISNLSGKWIRFDTAANTDNITPGSTEYIISPRVVFSCDATDSPKAYTVVNTYANNIASVVIVDRGNKIFRTDVSIVSNNVYGTGANCYCVTPPPGGHGSNPVEELEAKAMEFAISFANTEGNTIPTNIDYSRIGLLKNPYILNANNTKGGLFTSNTFSQALAANLSSVVGTFTVGDVVIGNTSCAKGIVTAANSSYIYIVGDKFFSNNERIYVQSTPTTQANVSINTRGSIFDTDLTPIYVNSINNVDRNDSQTESFKVIIQI